MDETFLNMLANEVLFYKTKPSPCSYLPNRQETKILTHLTGDNTEALHALLLEIGFRRSQSIAYKPICQGCNACTSLRIPVMDFKPNKTQKRVLRYNKDIYRRITSPVLTQIQYDLYQKYIHTRHAGEEMSKMDENDVAMMIEESTIDTAIIEYWINIPEGEKLIGWVMTDFTNHGLSMVYSVFDPDYSDASLGTFAILDHILLARDLSFPYLYLGYWIKESPKMSYKAQFKPHELFIHGMWQKS